MAPLPPWWQPAETVVTGGDAHGGGVLALCAQGEWLRGSAG